MGGDEKGIKRRAGEKEIRQAKRMKREDNRCDK